MDTNMTTTRRNIEWWHLYIINRFSYSNQLISGACTSRVCDDGDCRSSSILYSVVDVRLAPVHRFIFVTAAHRKHDRWFCHLRTSLTQFVDIFIFITTSDVQIFLVEIVSVVVLFRWALFKIVMRRGCWITGVARRIRSNWLSRVWRSGGDLYRRGQ